ncbi:MFS transporter [Kitasatospora nipponensis]|uniref:MFS transporter n=1 Tax=Kitasatospora nipponensis TaxID=258049 RepID=A0ABN1W606_9ACTN
MTILSPVSNTATPTERGSGATLAVLVGAYLMIGVDSTVINVALPKIQHELHFSPTGLSWVLNSYTLAFGGLLLLGSRIGDRLGRRRTFTAGVLLFTLASLLGGLAPDNGWLLAARALQGVGAALATPNVLALIATNFAEGPQRNRALSIYSATAGIGASVGLVLGGLLTSFVSWRWALLINVPVGTAVALAAPRLITQPPRHSGHFDAAGALTGTLGTTALVYGFIRVAGHSWGDGQALAGFGAALLLLAGFLLIERRAAQPVVPLRLLADRNRAGAYLNLLLIPAGMLPAFFFLTLFVQNALGYSPLRAGFAFLPLTLSMFTAVRLAPRALARFGPRPVLVAGAVLLTVAGLWLTQLRADGGFLTSLLGPMLVLGLGAGFSFMPMSALVLTGVGAAESGAAAGLLQTLQWTGGTVGLAVLVTVYGTAGRHGSGDPVHHLVRGLDAAFTGATAITVLALLVTVLVLRTPPRDPAAPQPSAGARRPVDSAAGR